MGKRSPGFKRRPQDKYYTPYQAVLPLLPHLTPRTHFFEPCAGDGRLIRHLARHGHVCVDAFDVAPEDADVGTADALTAEVDVRPGDTCITNPPWTRDLLHPLIDRWRRMMPTWFLFDADWAHTVQAVPYLPFCRKIVSIGRVKWIEGSTNTGVDNSCWYMFDDTQGPTLFFGRD